MKLNIYKKSGEVLKTVAVNSEIFGLKDNNQLIAEAVRQQLLSRRDSIAHTKQRGEVSGGGKKPWRQKGTGRARAGSTRSPIWRGGGITFGPTKNINHAICINKKAKIKARNIALSQYARKNMLFTIDKVNDLSRNDLYKLIQKLKIDDKKILLITSSKEKDLYLITRNMPEINNLASNSLNVYDLLNSDAIIWSQEVLSNIDKNIK